MNVYHWKVQAGNGTTDFFIKADSLEEARTHYGLIPGTRPSQDFYGTYIRENGPHCIRKAKASEKHVLFVEFNAVCNYGPQIICAVVRRTAQVEAGKEKATYKSSQSYTCPIDKFRIKDVLEVVTDEDLQESLEITFTKLTQIELDELPEFEGF